MATCNSLICKNSNLDQQALISYYRTGSCGNFSFYIMQMNLMNNK